METKNTIPERSGIAEAYQWRLEDMYVAREAWENDFAEAKKMIAHVETIQASLLPSPESIRHALDAVYALEKKIGKIYSYARMRRDEDSRKPDPQAMTDRAESLAVEANAATAFLNPALLSMPEQLLKDLLQDPSFEAYDRILFDILRNRAHTLPAEQEALLAKASEIGNAPSNIYSLFTEADLTFPMITGEDGNPALVNDARLLTFLSSRNGRVRQEAYETVLDTYGQYGNTFAALYGASVKHDVFTSRTRKFAASLEASLYANEIPATVYDALLQAVHERLPALNRYLKLKQGLLGLDDMHMWDLYVDTAQDFDMKLSYDDAYALVLKALSPLGEDYLAVLAQAKTSGWVDVYENAGKHHGAYSWGCYGVHPYVLLNFEGTLESASTLAHELGHAMHSHLSNQAQPFTKADYTLFSAEVASTVNEILLSCYLLDAYAEKDAQQSLLCSLLEHFRRTMFRQALFAAFEKETHAMQERGEALTKDSLCNAYYHINEVFYGKACVLDDAVRHEWMRIPHFYRAYYVYQYATGFSAAVCIARKILAEGKPAVEGYKQFLSAGSALPPIDALRLAGVDMETPQPVREALDWFEEILQRYERLCG